MITVKCKKDLFMDGAKVASFTKGKIYNGSPNLTANRWNDRLSESTVLIDDQGDAHTIGIWLKHFVVSKVH